MEISNYIEMNKRDLKKLSKSQLIDMLLKQEKKPKNTMVNKKPNKEQKVVYNHDNLFDNDPFQDFTVTSDPFERTMKKVIKQDKNINAQTLSINDKYSKLLTNEKKVTHYPMIKATLDEFRREEIRRSNDKNRRSKSFVDLFGKRLNEIQGRRDKVSIRIHIKLSHALRGMIETVSEHTYGPFTVHKPYNMSKRDGYKFALYIVMSKNITFLSGESVTQIGFEITQVKNKKPQKHKLGQLKLESYLLNKQRPITRHGKNTCVIDYVWDQVRGQRGFKSYTYEKLKSEIYEFVAEGDDMISTDELINWADKCHNNVSIHAFDARYKKFVTHNKNCSNICLVYIVKDHHCYPITDKKLKIVASKANQGGCNDLLKHMTDIKWTRRHENVSKLNSINEIYSLDKENNIIIIPEE